MTGQVRVGRARRRGLLGLIGVLFGLQLMVASSAHAAIPTTTLSTDPQQVNGSNGWFITTTTVSLTSNEAGPTFYLWDSNPPEGDPSWIPYSAPLTAPEGQHTIYYYSADTANNTETVQTQAVKVDTQVPSAWFYSPSQDATVSGSADITATAWDANFAQYTVEYGAGKRPGRPDSLLANNLRLGTWWRGITTSTVPASNAVLATWDTTVLDNSEHTLRLVARDQAGNTSASLRAVRTGNPGRPWLEEVTEDAVDFMPEIRPDGQSIAFTSDRRGTMDLWTANLDGSALTALTTSTADDRHPSFSPDGQSVVFMSDRAAGDFDIWKMNVNGTGLTRLTSTSATDWAPVWSPDGLKIAYFSEASGNRDVYIMNADGTSQTNLTNDPGGDFVPAFSPNGTKIVFVSNRYGLEDIFIMNTDGTGLARLTAWPGSETHPSFSPDGQRIVFSAGRNAGQSDVWVMNVDGTNPRKLTEDPAPEVRPMWNWTSNKIAFESGRSGVVDIYTMNPDGSNEQRVTFGVTDFVPDISHDSSQVAFSSNRARQYASSLAYAYRQGDDFLVGSGGTGMTFTGEPTANTHHPSFSPDGLSMVYNSNKAGSFDVWKMNLDGSGQTRLTSNAATESVPTWEGDGSVSYAGDASGNDDIYVMNSDGTAQIVVAATAGWDRFPDGTTDGQKIAFSSTLYDTGDVFTVNRDGTGLTRLTTVSPSGNEWHPSFNPAGDKISYTSNGSNIDLYVMDADGSNQTRLTYDQAVDYIQTWSGDGRSIVFVTGRANGPGALTTNGMSIWKMTTSETDTVQPVTSISTSPAAPDGSNGWYRSAPTVTLGRNEPGSTWYSWDSSPAPGDPAWNAYAAAITASEGSHTLYYYSVDSAGNTETAQSQVFKVDSSAPTADAGSDKSANEADAITFDGSASSDGQSPIALFEWDWDSDGTYDLSAAAATTTTATHAWAAPGTGRVTLRVTNEAGLTATDSADVTIADLPGLSFARLTTDSATDSGPDWDTAGDKIVWGSLASGNFDVWTMNADGSGKSRLTTDPAADQGPSFSPDGTKVVFSSLRSGNNDIWVMDADGSDPIQLTTDTASDSGPDFSPDGSRIAFSSTRGGTTSIWVMGVDGSSQTRLTDGSAPGNAPDWNAAGTRIVFGTGDIWSVGPDGTNLVRLTTDTANDTIPSFRGDGCRVIFSSTRTGSGDLYTMRADGTDPRRLTSSPALDTGPNWARTGDKAVYTTTSEGNYDIWSVTFGPSADEDASKVVQLTTSTADDIGQDGHMGIMKRLYGSSSGAFRIHKPDYPSVDNRFLISANTTPSASPYWYSASGEQYGSAVRFTPPTTPYVIDKVHVYGYLTGTQVADAGFDLSVLADDRTPLYRSRFRREDFFSNTPAWVAVDVPDLTVSGPVYLVISTPMWSRGGINIGVGSHDPSYSSVLLTRIQDLWKLNLDGSGKEQLTNDPSFNGGGKFDRAGSRIVFVSDRGSDSLDIWKMNADGSGQTQLTTGTANELAPVWSPDGSEIVYHAWGPGANQIWTMHADGSGPSQLTTDGSSWGATFTPDGSKILFTSSRATGLDVWSMNPDGSGQVRLTTDPATDESPKPSIDGTKVLFESLRNGRSDIYVVNIDGTGETRLTSDPGVDMMPSWGPDGQHINFVSDRLGGSDLWVMNVDGSGQTQLTTNLSEDSQTGWRWDGVRMGFASRRAGNWDLYVYKYLNEDTTPPATTLSASPAAPDGSSGWYRSAPSVTLTRDEPGSTWYSWDSSPAPGDPAWNAYSSALAALEGSHTLYHYSVDSAGNTETAQGQAFKVDTIAPAAPVLDRPYDLSTTNNSAPRLRWGPSSDSGSGFAGYDAILDGSVVSGGLLQTTTTVNPVVGPHTWTVRARDLAGNQAAPAARTLTKAASPAPFPWRRVATQGFGQPANVFPLSMAVFAGRLFLSTENSQQGGQIWSSADGLAWTQAAPSGFGTTANTAIGGLAVFGSYLYAGTYNAASGCQVWRTADGTNWTQVASGGFNDTGNRNLRRLVVFGSYLYAGTRNNATGGEAWRTADGTNWAQVNADGFGDSRNADAWNARVFKGSLYFATINLTTGGEVWRTADGSSWQQANSDGFGDASNKQVIGFAELGGYLYAGTGAHTGVETCAPVGGGADVWRSPDGTSWTLVTGDGFGDAFNCAAPLSATQGSHLYVPMRDDSNGVGMWRTTDGSSFQRVNADGFGNSGNLGVPWMQVYQNRLYAGLINYQDGLEVWRIEDTTAPSAPSTLAWTGLSTDTVTLGWGASSDAVGVTYYTVHDGFSGAGLATVTATQVTLQGLTSGSARSFYVRAHDAIGNVSTASNLLSVTMPTVVVAEPVAQGTSVEQAASVTLPQGEAATLTVSFSEVTTAGTLNIVVTPDPPAEQPVGFTLAGTYYDVSFDGGYAGPIDVTLPYGASVSDADAANLRLFHWEDNAWQDVTVSVDTANHTITGRVTSLSPFGIGGPLGAPATGANTWGVLALGGMMILIGSWLARRRGMVEA